MGFVEKKAPEQYQFTEPGQKIEGVLVGVSRPTVKGKPVTQYLIQKYNGTGRVTLLATADLAQKIERDDLGHPIYIEFTGYRDDVEKQGNKMRTFKVMVDHDEGTAADHITDDDVPF